MDGMDDTKVIWMVSHSRIDPDVVVEEYVVLLDPDERFSECHLTEDREEATEFEDMPTATRWASMMNHPSSLFFPGWIGEVPEETRFHVGEVLIHYVEVDED